MNSRYSAGDKPSLKPQRDCLHHNHLSTLHHLDGVLQLPWPTLLDHPAISPILYKKLLHLHVGASTPITCREAHPNCPTILPLLYKQLLLHLGTLHLLYHHHLGQAHPLFYTQPPSCPQMLHGKSTVHHCALQISYHQAL